MTRIDFFSPIRALALAAVLPVLAVPVALGAPPVLSGPSFLPGDDALLASSGRQYSPEIVEGDNQYLAVWVDARTSFVDPGIAVGNVTINDYVGTSMDVYAARLDAAGSLIDTTPILVAQDLQNQAMIDVAWNGTNYLVVYTGQSGLECCPVEDRYAKRVSPAGLVLDSTPITLATGTTANALWPGALAGDGTNWVFTWITNSQMLATRIANDGTVLDPAGVVIVSSISITGEFDLENAAGQYLLAYPGSLFLMGQRFGPDLTPIGGAFRINTYGPSSPRKSRIATDGTDYFVAWWEDRYPIQATIAGTRVSHTGTVLDLAGIHLTAPVYNPYQPAPDVAWDGTNWIVAYDTRSPVDIVAARVSPAGVVLDYDTSAIPVSTATEKQYEVAIACVSGGSGAAVLWFDNRDTPAGGSAEPGDVYAAVIQPDGSVGANFPVAVGAPRQSHLDLVPNDTGYLAVYRSESSPQTRILAQRLDALGAAIDLEPVEVAAGNSDLTNPAVAWNGTLYLVVWEDFDGGLADQTYGRRMAADLTPLDPAPFAIMPGNTPDVAAIGDVFAVTSSWENPHEVRGAYTVRVRGSDGTLLDASPQLYSSGYAVFPSIATVGGRWLAAWESHPTHDDPSSTVHANFVDTNGVAATGFLVDLNNSTKPSVAGRADQGAIVFAGSTGPGLHDDIFAVRYLPDGTAIDPTRGITLTNEPASQFDVAAAWDGSEWVSAFADFRSTVVNEAVRSDLYAGRFDDAGAVLDPGGFAVAASGVPEMFPHVAGSGGSFVVGGSVFRPETGYASYRIALGLGTSASVVNAPAVAAGPMEAALHPAWPNPFRSSTTIAFDLERAGTVALTVYDAAGRRVRVLERGVRSAGRHAITWDGTDSTGGRVGAGVYFVRMAAELGEASRRVIVLR